MVLILTISLGYLDSFVFTISAVFTHLYICLCLYSEVYLFFVYTMSLALPLFVFSIFCSLPRFVYAMSLEVYRDFVYTISLALPGFPFAVLENLDRAGSLVACL